MAAVFFEGLLLQASLIFALGAQNLFVFESGLKKNNSLAVCFVCFLCDLSLIMIGVAGAATLFSAFSQIKIIIGAIGVIFLLHYGLGKIFSTTTEVILESELSPKKNLRRSILLAITFSVLNPHAYLDAFVLIGGYSAKYSLLDQRLFLGLGAACFSGIWFLLLSSASNFIKPVLSNPQRMRVFMCVSGLVLVYISGKLSLDVFSWTQGPQSSLPLKFLEFPVTGHLFTSILY